MYELPTVIISKTKKAIIGSLSLIMALAWNSAFQNWFDNNETLHKGGPWAYAIIVTTLIISIIYFMD
jgi:hypothetical protein